MRNATRLRIAVVTETYPPQVNGVARTIGTMVRELDRRNHSIQLIRPRQHPRDHGEIEPGINTVLVPGIPVPRYADLRMGLPAKRLLLRNWKARRPDVVQVVTEGPLGTSAISAARQLGIPVVSEFHTNFHLYSRHYGFGLLAALVERHLRRLHHRADCTLVPTDEMKAALGRTGYSNLHVVGRGIDTSSFNADYRCAALRRSWGVDERDIVALYVGRVAPEKNLALFVEAVHAMRTVLPRLRAVVVGDGPGLDALRISQPDYVYAGMRSGKDLARHYASADIFVFPSLTETFGNVTTEAMASGLAVVAFDYAAARLHIRHGENGLIAARDQPGDFVERAQELAADPALRRRLRAAASDSAQALDWTRVVDELEAVFHQIITEASLHVASVMSVGSPHGDHASL